MALAVKQRDDAELARMALAVEQLKPALSAYAREHGGRFILFGSAARREMRPGSDVDIFVDFPDGPHMAAIRFADDTCWQLGLRPDVLGFGAPAGRLRTRIETEGLVLPGDEERWSDPMSNEDRWGDVLDAARSAASHFRAAERIFLRGGLEDSGDTAYERRMAFYHSMQSAHTSLESALKRALVAVGERLPTGSEWHKELVQSATRPLGRQGQPILNAELAAAVMETLGFRHFASHAYDAPFLSHRALRAVEAGRIIADRIEGELRAFIEAIGAG